MAGPRGQVGLYVSAREARTPPDGAQSLTSRGTGGLALPGGVRPFPRPFHCGHSSVFLKPRGGGANRPGVH